MTSRPDAGAAVSGLFATTTATGGLAGRAALRTDRSPQAPRLRLGVELTEEQIGWLRSLSRPTRTGAPRTLGSKFVAAGFLAAAIELAKTVDVEMFGVIAGDDDEMTARARDALVRAALHHASYEPTPDTESGVTP